MTRDLLLERILRLDMAGALALLGEIFPLNPDPALGLDFGEPPGPREGGAYAALWRRQQESAAVQDEAEPELAPT